MLYLGKRITSAHDNLQPVELSKITKALKNPKGKVAQKVEQLQQVRVLDAKQYRRLKTELPYLVCAKFHPMVRRKENFLHTKRFLIDIDHLTDFEIDQTQLRLQLQSDKRVELLFSSPSGDGLKVLFRLQEPIDDSSYYTLFYKAFCVNLNHKYKLGAAIDSKTNDVTRCCFVSYDPETYYNPSAEAVDAAAYLNQNDFIDFDQVSKTVKETEQQQRQHAKQAEVSLRKTPQEVPDKVLDAIKARVGKRIKKERKKTYIQPEQLNDFVSEIKPVIEEMGAQLSYTKPINYGRVLHITVGKHWAELNIFYGQRGVTVVPTTKTGSHRELVEDMALLLKDYFANR